MISDMLVTGFFGRPRIISTALTSMSTDANRCAAELNVGLGVYKIKITIDQMIGVSASSGKYEHLQVYQVRYSGGWSCGEDMLAHLIYKQHISN